MSKKTVLFVAPYFPPHSGGLERYVAEVSKQLSLRGSWKVVVLTTSDTGFDCRETHGEVLVHRLAFEHTLSNTPFSFSWFFKVKRVLREVQPDVVNVHTPVPGLGDLVSLMLPKKVPFVVTYHAESMRKGVLLLDTVVWFYEHVVLGCMLRKATKIICVSDAVRNGIMAKYKHKSVTVTPGVDTSVFAPGNTKPEVPTLLFVASLGKGQGYKGLKTLLDAFVSIRAHVVDVTLRIVGDGEERAQYEAYARNLGVSDAVTFVGRLEGSELVREYQGAHLLVHPTSKESFGMVIAEAMSCELPVVSTAVGGIPALVQHGVTGVLIEPRDTDGVAREVIRLLGDEGLMREYGIAGRKRIEEHFGWEKRIDLYSVLFEQVLEKKQTVAHVVGYFPPHVGGMEVVADDLSHELARRGYAVTVLTSNLGAKDAPKAEHSEGRIVRRLTSIEFAHTPIMWTLPFRLLALPKGTIVHVHLAQALVPEVALVVSWLRRFPFVVHFHLDVEPSGTLGWLFILYKKHVLPVVLRRADTVIVFSKEQKRFVCEVYCVEDHRVHIVPNGVDPKGIAVREGATRHEPMRLLYVGRLTVQKRVERLVEAVARMNVPVELTVVGDGEDRAKLEKLVQELQLTSVRFVGYKPLADARAYLAQTDVFVIPSDKEGMPIAVLEAMVAGVPIVGSNVMGVHELLDGVGVLVDDPSSESFAHTLNTLYSDTMLLQKLSTQSRERGKEYTVEAVGAKLENIYKKLPVW